MEFGCKAMLFSSEVDAPEASFRKYFESVILNSGKRWPFLQKRNNSNSQRKEVLFCKTIKHNGKDFFVGVLVSDSLKKTGFSRDGNIVKEIQLNANDEINLIVIQLSNYKALYGSYRGSVPMDSFFRYLWMGYLEFVRKMRDDSCPKQGKDPRWKEFSLKNKACSQRLISQASFEQTLNRLQHIHELAFTVSGYDPEISQLGSNISNQIKSTHQVIRFSANTTQSVVKQIIMKAYNASTRIFTNKEKKIGYVKGTDSLNYETMINFDDFSDDLFKTKDSSTLTLKLDEIEKYPPIKEMIDKFSCSCYIILQ